MVYDRICILYVCNYTLSSNVLSVMYVNQIKEYVFGIYQNFSYQIQIFWNKKKLFNVINKNQLINICELLKTKIERVSSLVTSYLLSLHQTCTDNIHLLHRLYIMYINIFYKVSSLIGSFSLYFRMINVIMIYESNTHLWTLPM